MAKSPRYLRRLRKMPFVNSLIKPRKLKQEYALGLLVGSLILMTVMVALNEYTLREHDQFLAQFNVQPPAATAGSSAYAHSPDSKGRRELAGPLPSRER